MSQARHIVEEFGHFATDGGQRPPWLSPVRQQAIERFHALGFPTTRDEDWHYTSVAPIIESPLQVRPGMGGTVRAEELDPFRFATDWPLLVFVNGRFSSELSSLDDLPAGVRVVDLQRAWTETPRLVREHLAKIAGFERQAFTALNTAFVTDGALVHVEKDVSADRPIHLLHVTDAVAAETAIHPRTLIVAERHAKVTVLESFVATTDAQYFTNAVAEVVVDEGATVNHYRIQRESLRAFHIGTVQTRQARDSHYVSFSFATGAALSRTNIYTELAGEGCGTTLNGLYMIGGDQHCDHQTFVDHAQPNCFSREVYKGVLDGASRGVFNGKVYVHPIAQKTDGKQENHALLLSPRARVDTKPQLEIFADDVKCTHGATVGKLDETSLFYMKSRGIADDRARELLIYAFAADVIEQLELDPLRDGLEALTMRRFTKQEELVGAAEK